MASPRTTRVLKDLKISNENDVSTLLFIQQYLTDLVTYTN